MHDNLDTDPNYTTFGEDDQQLNASEENTKPRDDCQHNVPNFHPLVHSTGYSLIIQNYSESSSDTEVQLTDNNENQMDDCRKKTI